jgi:hypothetical protein
MKKFLLILALAALHFAGCGDGDDGGSDAGDGGGSAAGTSEEGSESSEESDTDFSGKGGGDFCDLAKKYEEDFEDTGDPTAGGDIEKEFTELTEAIDKLADEAPGEIKDDTEKIAAAFNEYNALLKKYNYDFTKIPESETQNIDIENPDVEAASNRVESYFEKVCGMDSDGDGDTDGVIDDDGAAEDDSTSESGDEQAPADETEDTSGE